MSGSATVPLRLPEGVRRLLANPRAALGIAALAVVSALVLFGDALSPWRYSDIDWTAAGTNVGPTLERAHYFGVDASGRDVFVRTLVGGRISLAVGLVAMLVSAVIGTLYGAISGFAGGRIDEAMMRFVDFLYSLPYIFFVIILVVLFGRSIVLIFVAIGAIEWLTMARIVRALALSIRQKEFIEAARAAGLGRAAILRRHILPNVAGPVVVYATLTVPSIILAESFISFLGLGVQEPLTSWGRLISEGAQDMEISPWLLIFPAAFMALTLLSLNLLGDALRDILDPRDR